MDSTGCIECKVNCVLYNKNCYSKITGCIQYNGAGCTSCDSNYDF